MNLQEFVYYFATYNPRPPSFIELIPDSFFWKFVFLELMMAACCIAAYKTVVFLDENQIFGIKDDENGNPVFYIANPFYYLKLLFKE